MYRYWRVGVAVLVVGVLCVALLLRFYRRPVVQEPPQPVLESWIEQRSLAGTREFIFRTHQNLPETPLFNERQMVNPLLCEAYMYILHLRNNGAVPAVAIACTQRKDLLALDFGSIERAMIVKGPDTSIADDGYYYNSTAHMQIINLRDYAGSQQIELPPGGELSYHFLPFNGLRASGPIKPGVYTVVARFRYLAHPDSREVIVDSRPIDITVTVDDIKDRTQFLRSFAER